MPIVINGKTYAAQEFAWDGCHKIYLINSAEDRQEMLDNGYTEPGDIRPIFELRAAWEASCPLRFISRADLSGPDIVPQGAEEDGPVLIEYVENGSESAAEGSTAAAGPSDTIDALVARLRALGAAVVVWEPSELDGIDPRRMENVLVDEGVELLEAMWAQRDREADA